MRLIKDNNFNFHFSYNFGMCLLLLLMSFSAKMTAQMYVSSDAVVAIDENTIIHISDDSEDAKAKIYVAQGAKLINFPADSLHEIVYLEKEKPSETSQTKIARKEKKNGKPSKSSELKNNEYIEKEVFLTVFISKSNKSSAVFVSFNRLNAISGSSVSFSVKLFPTKTRKENVAHVFYQNLEDQNIQSSFIDELIISQYAQEKYITRPPPFQFS